MVECSRFVCFLATGWVVVFCYIIKAQHLSGSSDSRHPTCFQIPRTQMLAMIQAHSLDLCLHLQAICCDQGNWPLPVSFLAWPSHKPGAPSMYRNIRHNPKQSGPTDQAKRWLNSCSGID